MRQELDAGLRHVATDTPLRAAYLEAGAAVTRLAGPQAWLEAGAHPWPGVSAFARAYVQPGDAGAIVGLRYEWEW